MELKDFTVSSELLSEVLKLEVVKHSLFNKSSNTFNVTYIQSEDSLKANWMPVNVYEFVFKCKDWASNLGYQIISGPSDEQAYRKNCEQAYSEVFWYEGDDVHRTYKNELFLACTEQEAIIIASEWVLSEVNK